MSPLLRLSTVLLFSLMMSIAQASPSLDFSVFDTQARSGGKPCVVFLGGSLTWGAQATSPMDTSYRALVEQRLIETYPKAHFQFWDAAIGGTGSQLAAFRLERDVLAHKPDLVFLEFTINDNPYVEPVPARLASYEALVRRLVQAGIPVVQVILPAKQDVGTSPGSRPLDAKHKEIAAAYGLPVADAVALAKARVAGGGTTPDLLWDLPEDVTHPGDAGYALYAEAAWDAFQRAVAEKRQCRLPGKMLHADTYMTVNRFRLSGSQVLPAGWRIGKPHRNAVAFDFVCSRWMDDLVIAQAGAAPLRLTFQGSDLMLFGEMTKLSGSFRASVDGGEPVSYPAKCADGNMRLVTIVATGLESGVEHQVEIMPDLKHGEELRIESVCVAGGDAVISFANSAPGLKSPVAGATPQ